MSRKTHTSEMVIERTMPDAINLFTPKGEEQWVPGWKPDYVRPPGGETEEEMVFITGDGDEKTIWTCLKWRPQEGHARYLRMTPKSRVAIVDVRCRPDGAERTRATVSYEVQSLTDAGEKWLEAFSGEAFAEMIDEWSELIRRLES